MGCGSSTSVQTVASNGKLESKSNIQDAKDNLDLGVVNLIKETKPMIREKHVFHIGDKVHVSGYTGVVKVVGQLDDQGDEKWLGIELNHQHPQGNNGDFQGVQHFTCKPKHGLFSRASSVFPYSCHKGTKDESFLPQTIVFDQRRIRRCLASAKIREFKKVLEMEEKINAHVSSTPEQETGSVERLSKYLTNPWEGERSKAYAIFGWVIFHVDYDVDEFFGRMEEKSADPGRVLKDKCCVCAGYVNIFEALVKEAGLKVHTIEGYAKGYGYEPGQRFTTSNHAWNAVQINGEWFICDPTWGAGVLGNDLMFHRKPNLTMFLMDPKYAICSHYPLDENW